MFFDTLRADAHEWCDVVRRFGLARRVRIDRGLKLSKQREQPRERVSAGVRVAHVAGGALAVAVAGSDITVTVTGATTATQVANAVSSNVNAAALVDVFAYGTGASVVSTIGLTNLGYTSPNALAVSGIPDTSQALIQQRLDRCKTEAGNIQTSSSALQTSIDGTIVPQMLVAQTAVNESGLDLITVGTALFDAEQARLALVSAVAGWWMWGRVSGEVVAGAPLGGGLARLLVVVIALLALVYPIVLIVLLRRRDVRDYA